MCAEVCCPCNSLSFFWFSFFIIIGGHVSFYGATDTPVLDFWWWLLWAALFAIGGDVHDVHSLGFTSCVTPTNLPMTIMAVSNSCPHVCFSRGRMPDSNGDLPHSSLMRHQRLATFLLILYLVKTDQQNFAKSAKHSSAIPIKIKNFWQMKSIPLKTNNYPTVRTLQVRPASHQLQGASIALWINNNFQESI